MYIADVGETPEVDGMKDINIESTLVPGQNLERRRFRSAEFRQVT